MRKLITAKRLRQLVSYDPLTGVFTNIAPRKKVVVGTVAGTIDQDSGYVCLTLDRRRYYGHRLAFLYVHGTWPSLHVDHEDGLRSNNVFTNLRDRSRRFNQQNMRRAMSTNASGLLGAMKKRDRWTSQIRAQGRVIRLGTFGTAQAAHQAYVVAKRRLHEGCTI
jgi:HNH endonuclease/AP2 domain